ncbi:hypothetical protein [Deinococcus pimensis]|uniref:hypothetical protein n=1 Tax=Deinococcus pimensis TaxID=309888 RepID=UPI000481FC80|nr:hypothetical protein [Deinococcus pimensis]
MKGAEETVRLVRTDERGAPTSFDWRGQREVQVVLGTWTSGGVVRLGDLGARTAHLNRPDFRIVDCP